MVHESFLLCWGASFAGEKKVRSAKLTSPEVLDRDDSRIVNELADLIRSADVVVAHNGDRFDLPMLNNRILLQGLEPLGHVESIDTLKLAKKNFRFTHNRLDHLARHLGLGTKIKTDFELWVQVVGGDELAMQRMVRYCRHDVVLLGQIFDKLRPYVKGLKRLMDAAGEACPNCGSTYLVRRGYTRTQASTFVKYQCQECKRYMRARRSIPEKKSEYHPL
jgi:predicted RNA-binding Zn-ribbon protein involved in translation (DUF1610 family)